ncbi:hypothetical protein [Microbulbifer sp. VAAF005]|uniref:hypothetical protein n=1 Tax=Microbulbifer sp. VAAF005 TaxID=3034230 RepID=UPI0024ACE03C|nr:hypothetical protein [Microbulbifer sp. VAAF005]WHI45880.1 hypothetical protein P0078_19495 [Microbulbifer sp. VAAF005]
MSFFGGVILFIAIVGTATMVGNKLRGKETSSWKSIWGPFVFFGAIGLGLFIGGQDEPTQQPSPNEITTSTLNKETMAGSNDFHVLQVDPNNLRVVFVSEFDDADHGELVNFYIGEDGNNFCEINLPTSEVRSGLTVESKKRSPVPVEYFNISCRWADKYFVRSTNHNTWAKFSITEWDRETRQGVVALDVHLATPEIPPKGEYLTMAGSNIQVASSDWK